MHSYYSFDYVLRLPINKITRLLTKAFEKSNEKKAWQLYLMKYQHMDEQNYKPFDEFYQPGRKVENKSQAEILNEVKDIINAFKGGENNRDI